MRQNGCDDRQLAQLMQLKLETVKLNMGRADYKTRRGLSDPFLPRARLATGLALVEMPRGTGGPAYTTRKGPPAARQSVCTEVPTDAFRRAGVRARRATRVAGGLAAVMAPVLRPQ
jgi:hypothetical protein